MNIPTDYLPGHERARAINPALADKYVAHTRIGDPEADDMMEELAGVDPEQAFRFLQAGMDEEHDVLRDAPPTVRAFFEDVDTPPAWVDEDAFQPGVRMFLRNSKLVLGAMLGGVLVEGLRHQHQQVLLHHRAGCAIRASAASSRTTAT